jgi:MerR family transcriptional regulator/heat shock protein HspR
MFKERIKNNPVYPIREAAKLLNISVHTLRMYEKAGLIIPYKKESSHRLYSDSDLERIRCFRDAINKEKISIEGIKRLLSLIPCWTLVKCSEEDRQNCQAIYDSTKPCWAFKHKNNICANLNCRECEVYNSFTNCEKIKQTLFNQIISKDSCNSNNNSRDIV